MDDKKTILCLTLFFVFLSPALLQAQTAAELEAVLENPAITYSQAAWFVYASAGTTVSMDGVDFQEAFDRAMSNGWLTKKAAPDDPIKLGAVSFLMMKAFGIKGGLMYMILPGPRYAFRTMVSRSLIQGGADPGMKVNGERFLFILGNVLNVAGGEE